MSMNYMILRNAHDLSKILNQSFLLTGNIRKQEQETEHNMWAIACSKKKFSEIEQTLHSFVISLHKVIEKQLHDSKSTSQATLYLWFDEQAGQLRFNVISGRVEKLPFGCTVEKMSDSIPIIRSYLSSPYLHGIPEDGIEEISLDDDRNDDDDIEYVLPVYVDYITTH